MNRIEFVARRLCAADGCPAEAPAIAGNRQLMRTPMVQIWPPDAKPAWHFYVPKAYDILRAADLWATLQGQTEGKFGEIAALDNWASHPNMPKVLPADADMQALR